MIMFSYRQLVIKCWLNFIGFLLSCNEPVRLGQTGVISTRVDAILILTCCGETRTVCS